MVSTTFNTYFVFMHFLSLVPTWTSVLWPLTPARSAHTAAQFSSRLGRTQALPPLCLWESDFRTLCGSPRQGPRDLLALGACASPCRLAPTAATPGGQHSQGSWGPCWTEPGHTPTGGACSTGWQPPPLPHCPAVSKCPSATFRTGLELDHLLPLPWLSLWPSHRHLSPGSLRIF